MLRRIVTGVVLLNGLLFFVSCNSPTGGFGSGRQENITLILGAFSEEVKPIQAELENKREGRIEGISFAEGKLRGRRSSNLDGDRQGECGDDDLAFNRTFSSRRSDCMRHCRCD